MGRKKKKPIKPWCWYCNREFDDDKILAQHQRAKHFKCPFCHKKLYSGPGLTVHCIQVHKEKLDKIPEALPNRNSVDIDIYGMQGVPEEDLREHERLKRGDDGQTKPRNDHNQQSSSQQNRPSRLLNNQYQNASATNSAAIHASMLHPAFSMGTMPSASFPMPPPGMPMPPPGFPMPPGFPGMLPMPAMHPGMPPGFAFPPTLLPSSTMANVPPPPIGFPPPPPPPPPPSSSELETEPRQSSEAVPPPPPMSGVGPLIGIPPPNFGTALIRPPQAAPLLSNAKQSAEIVKQEKNDESQQTTVARSSGDWANSSVATTTIAKPAIITTSSDGSAAQSIATSDSFIDVPSSKIRIMHPNSEFSLEELRLKLTKYQKLLKEKGIGQSQEAV